MRQEETFLHTVRRISGASMPKDAEVEVLMQI